MTYTTDQKPYPSYAILGFVVLVWFYLIGSWGYNLWHYHQSSMIQTSGTIYSEENIGGPYSLENFRCLYRYSVAAASFTGSFTQFDSCTVGETITLRYNAATPTKSIAEKLVYGDLFWLHLIYPLALGACAFVGILNYQTDRKRAKSSQKPE